MILKETRPCRKGRSCKGGGSRGVSKGRGKKNKRRKRGRKTEKVRTTTGDMQHIVRKKKLSKKSRGELRKHRAFFSTWTRWTTCNGNCTTVRSRYCNFETICQKEKVVEEAYCYIEGSRCQKWYRQGKKILHLL